MKIRPIEENERDNYACSPCWLKSQRAVDATVIVEHTYGVLEWPAETPMCANHAELLDVQQEEKQK